MGTEDCGSGMDGAVGTRDGDLEMRGGGMYEGD
jgi:hypothetical protein